MSNLFNIEQEYLNLIRDIEEAEGEITDEIQEKLSINRDEFEDKMRAYHYIIAGMKGDITTISDEQDRLSKLKTSKDNAIKTLKKNMITAIELYGDKGKTGNYRLNLGDIKMHTVNRKGLVFNNESEFYNTDYMRFKLTEPLNIIKINKVIAAVKDEPNQEIKYTAAIDKKLLLADLKNEVEVDGVGIVVNASLTIK